MKDLIVEGEHGLTYTPGYSSNSEQYGLEVFLDGEEYDVWVEFKLSYAERGFAPDWMNVQIHNPDSLEAIIKKLKVLHKELKRQTKLVKKAAKSATDKHLGCYSYPNCEDAPLGCCVQYGLDAESYGHRD